MGPFLGGIAMNRIWLFTLASFAVLVGGEAAEKVLIISHHCAQPFFVDCQAETLRKFLKDDYEVDLCPQV